MFSDIFCECDVDSDPVNIKACHPLKSNQWPEKVIVKIASKKDASKVLGVRRN